MGSLVPISIALPKMPDLAYRKPETAVQPGAKDRVSKVLRRSPARGWWWWEEGQASPL